MRINHNISALNAWRSITNTQYSMGKTLERLSSGLRINRAGDDAAGLAISEKMRGQIRGLNMAVKNAQDAISLIQTAEGALTEVHSILQRMRELAVQASSDTNTDVDRTQIQKELDQLREEIDRIARTTEFNTKKLLDGKLESFRPEADQKVVTAGNMNLEVVKLEKIDSGAGIDAKYDVVANDNSGKEYTFDLLGTEAKVTLKSVGANSVEVKVEIGTFHTTNTINGDSDIDLGDIKLKVDFTDNTNDKANLEFVVDKTLNTVTAAEATYVAEVGQFKGNVTSALDLRIAVSNDEGLAVKPVVDFSKGSVQVLASGKVEVSGNTVTLSDVSGAEFKWDKDVYTINDFNKALPKEEVVDSAVARIEGVFDGNTQLIFQIGANEGHNMIAGIDDMSSKALGLTAEALKVTTQSDAERAVMIVDAAIHRVSTARASLGAIQNRLEHTISNLGVAAENLTAAESRIRDADMAKEMMQFTKQQILLQSSMSMLAQANALPQNVLQLMR